MGLFNNLQLTNSPYIKQYQGLPLEEIQQTANVLQDRYYKNYAEMSKIDLLNDQRMSIQGDSELNKQLSEEYKQQVEELAKQGNFENLTGQVSALAKNYLGDKRRTALEENFNRFQKEQQLAQKMRAEGKTPIGFGDPSSFQSVDPETGEVNLYNSNLQTQLNYRAEQEQLFDDVVADSYGKSLSELTPEDRKQLGKAADIFIRTGSWSGVSSKKIKGMLESAFNRYKESAEYKQQKEVLGLDDIEIKAQLLDTGLEKVFNRTSNDFMQVGSLSSTNKPSGDDPSLDGISLFSGGEGATEATEDLFNNTIPEGGVEDQYELQGDIPSPAQTALSINTPGTATTQKTVKVGEVKQSSVDKMVEGLNLPNVGNDTASKIGYLEELDNQEILDQPANVRIAKGYLDFYKNNLQTELDLGYFPQSINKEIENMSSEEFKSFEKKTREAYKEKVKQFSSQPVYKVPNNDLATEFKRSVGLIPVGRDSEGTPIYDNNIEFLLNATFVGEDGKRVNVDEMVDEAGVTEFLEGEIEQEDIQELKSAMSIGNTFTLPTSSSEFGIEIIVNKKRYIMESPISQNKDLSTEVMRLNKSLSDPGYQPVTPNEYRNFKADPRIPVNGLRGVASFMQVRGEDRDVFFALDTQGKVITPSGAAATNPEEALTLTPKQVVSYYANLFNYNPAGNRQYTFEGAYKGPYDK